MDPISTTANDIASAYEESVNTSVQPEALEFSFDDAAVNSTAYHRVMAQQQTRSYTDLSRSTTLVPAGASKKAGKQQSIFSRFRKLSLSEDSQAQLYDDLCDAAFAGDLLTVQDLISRGVDPLYGSTTRYWLSLGPKKNRFTSFKNQLPPPMEKAILGGHPLVVQCLTRNGVKLHRDVQTALLYNFEAPNCDAWITRLLLAHPRAFDDACVLPPYATPHADYSSDFKFATILHHLAWRANAASLGVLQHLFDQGWQGDMNRKAEGGATPLHCACLGPSPNEASRLDMIELLLREGADPYATANLCLDANVMDSVNWTRTPLQAACLHGLEAIVATLIAHCSTPVDDATDSLGYTALHYAAAAADNPWILQTISDASSDIHPKSHSGSTPLHYACAAPDDPVSTVQTLLNRLPLASWPTDNAMSDTPLHYASAEGNTLTAKYLLRQGSNPNAQNAKGITPLMLAASRGHTSTIRALISSGAHIETATAVGPALFYACWYARVDAVRTLLDLGAHAHAVNAFRFNAADLLGWRKKAHYIPIDVGRADAILELLMGLGVRKRGFEQGVGRGLERAALDLTGVPRRFGNREYLELIVKA